MPDPLPPEAIYAAARQAGFSPDQAVTMTAIALAESGGNTGAHNSSGEDSRGLWQINLSPNANGNAPWAQTLDLFDPVDNARAAWEVSRHGADISPWTVTHSDRGSRYLEFRDEAIAAAAAQGENGIGNFVGPANYDSPDVPAGAAGGEPLPPPLVVEELPTGPGDVNRFLEAALAQSGDRYEMNVVARADDPDPDVFDCSELVEWAAAQVDVDVNTASYLQYLDMKQAGTLMDVERALDTPGALLFTFSQEPVPGGGRPSKAHVAISLGDGRVIEARSTKDGVGVFNAGDRFDYAALIPGMDYASAGVPTFEPAEPPTVPIAPAPPPDPLAGAAANAGGVDTDLDMLPDHFEIKYGLSPDVADTDGDGITDGYELIVLGTRATLLDSDFDGISDDMELALGLDPMKADNPDADAGMFVPDDLRVDSDGDGLADWGEMLGGTDPDDPDTDDDLRLDGDELFLGTDPLDNDDAVDDQSLDTSPGL
jgi:hypothetical protein